MSVVSKCVISKISESLVNLATNFDGYTRRNSQIKMAYEICQALTSDVSKVIVCEAGSGVGKTLAYLISSLPIALDTGKKLVISTSSSELMEQIVERDLSVLQSVYPDSFKIVHIKKPGTFVCRDRLLSLVSLDVKGLALNPSSFILDSPPSPEDFDLLTAMSKSLLESKWDGDIENWTGPELREDIRRAILCDYRFCEDRSSRHATCPYQLHQSALHDADVVVTSHAVLADDLVTGCGVLLPGLEQAIYVIDEAHVFPSAVRDATAAQFDASLVPILLTSFSDAIESSRLTGGMSGSQAAFHVSELREFTGEALSRAQDLLFWCETHCEHIAHENRTSGFNRFESGQLPHSLTAMVSEFSVALSALSNSLSRIRTELIRGLDNAVDAVVLVVEESLSEIGFYLARMREIKVCLSLLLPSNNISQPIAKWVEFDLQLIRYKFGASELQISAHLKATLWSKDACVVLSSATLRTDGTFDQFAYDCGLDDKSAAFFRSYPSPYDYTKQSHLIVPDAIPFEPQEPYFQAWLKDNLLGFLQSQRSSLVLFTSRKQMHDVRAHLEPMLTQLNTLIQCQNDAPREVVIGNHVKAIKNGFNSVIFGLFGFSEGLDLHGELLVNLVIVRLPFEVADSPLSAAMSEFESSAGNNAFNTVTLPNAVRSLVQSAGRLIRTERDSGRLIILDKRIISKRYGQKFIDALPPFKRTSYEQVKN
nr:helicase C-terminal domain-containing protein [Enterovibrio norvegicus]PMH64535.1 hypothetical protein BCU62_15890 [Enterovibrio norvegicus]